MLERTFVMNIQLNNNIGFNAKIIPNNTYEAVLDYAVQHNKAERFFEALKNIDKTRKNTFIQMDVCYTGDFPTVVFSRYENGWDKLSQSPTDYLVVKRQVDYISNKKENPLKYAFNRLIKLGNDAPNNKMYQEVVIKKDESMKKYCLF